MLVLAARCVTAAQTQFVKLSEADMEQQFGRIVNAIYIVEGGEHTKHPYGILSVKTDNPRHVCLVTVYHNHVRWQNAGSHGDFLDYLADVYCPPSADPQGNRNWHTDYWNIGEVCWLGVGWVVSGV